MLFSLEQLMKWFPHYDGTKKGKQIKHVSSDSRVEKDESLFIPIVGERFDGHDFIETAIEKGAIATLWNRSYQIPNHLKEKCLFFYVDDTLEALQELAKYYRETIDPIVVGITGSNGKTTTKDLVASVLNSTYRTHKTEGNFNNDIGLPLTILSMPNDTEVLVLEMGMNNFHEIERLARIARPDYAIITNIGESHIEYLGSREGIAKAKLEIVKGLKKAGTLIVDGDEALLQSLSIPQRIIGCSFKEKNRANIKRISNINVTLQETTFRYDGMTYKIPLTGVHHAKNAAYAIEVAKLLKVKDQNICNSLKQSEPTGMRFEQIETSSGAIIINDAYNASATSMIGAIEIVKQMNSFNRRIVVLGDGLELGEYTERFHRQIGEAISSPIDYVFTFGEAARYIYETAQNANNVICEHFTNRNQLINTLRPLMKKGTIALFKASRGMAFETLIEPLVTE